MVDITPVMLIKQLLLTIEVKESLAFHNKMCPGMKRTATINDCPLLGVGRDP